MTQEGLDKGGRPHPVADGMKDFRIDPAAIVKDPEGQSLFAPDIEGFIEVFSFWLDQAAQVTLFEIIPKDTPPQNHLEIGKAGHGGIQGLLEDLGIDGLLEFHRYPKDLGVTQIGGGRKELGCVIQADPFGLALILSGLIFF